MTGLLTIGLLVGVILLWSRLKDVERRIVLLEARPIGAAGIKAAREPDAEERIAPEPIAALAADPTPAVEPDPVISAEVPPAEIPAPPLPPTSAPVPSRTIGFEELFGSKLPIWGGGITLAIAGLFIVKYSIDAGLLSPLVRVILGLLFSALLVAGAEGARRWRETAIDPRVAQALAGAGVASAYSSILIATNLYHLIGPGTGFAGLALTTAAALALALRFGSPAAVLGLVGGLAAPALVGQSTSDIAPLTAYLALVIGGLAGVGRRQRWAWLIVSALVGGFGWGLVLLAFDTLDSTNTVALGAYTLLLALAIPFLLGGPGSARLLRAGAAIVGAVQIALIVVQGGYAPLDWAFYGLLSAGTIVLARIDPKQAMLEPIALLIGLATLLGWHHPTGPMLAIVGVGGTLLFAGSALARIWSAGGTWRDAIQAAAALGGTLAAACVIAPAGLLSDAQWSLLALAAAVPLALSAAIGARRALPDRDRRFLALGAAAALLACVALPALFDVHALPIFYAIAVALLAELWRRQPDLDYRGALAVALFAAAAAMAQSVADWMAGTILTITGEPLFVIALPTPLHALTDMLAPALILAAATWRVPALLPVARAMAGVAGAVAAGALFILYKQVFAIGSGSDFVEHGLAERVIFDNLLFVLGWLALSNRDHWQGLRAIGLAATALGLLRTLLYDALLFDPLWRHQLVGALPLANLIAPAFLFPLVWLALAGRIEGDLAKRYAPAIAAVRMALVALFAFATLRQAFHGSLLAAGGVGSSEDVSRSLVAILLALGYLRWGIFTRERIWRITSLVLMLGAVVKVFALDSAGLEGLARIASFVALGFSLIGIGWLYSRHLRADTPPAPLEGH